MRLKKYKLIVLLVLLMTGLSITGWAISAHYDISLKTAKIQKELKNRNQNGDDVQAESLHNKPVLFLISIGLIGLVGIRRQRKKPDNFQPLNTPRINDNSRKVELNKQLLS